MCYFRHILLLKVFVSVYLSPQYSMPRWILSGIHVAVYMVAQKLAPFLYALTLPNINRYLKLFHCQNQDKICNNTIPKDPTTPQVCRYTTL